MISLYFKADSIYYYLLIKFVVLFIYVFRKVKILIEIYVKNKIKILISLRGIINISKLI